MDQWKSVRLEIEGSQALDSTEALWCVLEQDRQEMSPNMTEEVVTGTLRINTNKTKTKISTLKKSYDCWKVYNMNVF